MSKVLYLVRHADTEKPSGGPHDFTRVLTAEGLIDAARMGRRLAEKGVKADAIVSSPSERTRTTAQFFAEQVGFDVERVQYFDSLYEGSPRQYLSIINELPETVESALLVGHNPTITYLAEHLCHEELGNLPTSAVVAISFEDLEWQAVSGRTGKLVFFDSPDKLEP
jgi:phosphohistidine phosphatase